MTHPVLEVRDLARHFTLGTGLLGGAPRMVKAVDGMDFAIPAGKTLALVGESGCGKTTATRMILRLDQPTRGRVLVDGQDIHALKGAALRLFRSKVQAVFQDPWSSLNPRMRVRDLVAEPLMASRKLTRKEVDMRVDKVLGDVGLRPDQARNFPHEFSGGQRQRIAIASALIAEPKLIVLDEPVSALDVSIRSQIMNLFKDIQQEYGVSYLLVAHDLATTRYLADEVAVMYLGRVVETGAADAIFSAPRHPYTRALFSAALPGHPDDPHDEIILSGELPSPLNPPTGCAFHPRCQMKLGEICATQAPILLDPGRLGPVACHHYPT
ncbi:ABC transporter ATP-binding protein [Ketogulonicigenium vulgare]|uniref:Oligopeptide/dipeptide ABC transporter, ATPase subunit n=1 Tax=Ketogulonicigenium vulgare (strain WSH-001) TaxID=759362 RepID=F9YAV4_KETVW|nr:oligopeptide/dipeptide ABC transporter ATP-binding protein [Ketogulonicigenium vulgare]ADO43979.1 peptide ABC transporter ATP-binding protein [Ketogulonicigenium vulgare Y25]AEM42506.1 Oligopeptide/dipeptide ABC transporter, ATPase subunit [Ketogulonicigenium vulgare WSH-001]ALJ82545.1 peptide ABC transporter substrate-binding protein [Ketogulonicigenium vulgare]ANW35319.1 peptide ABC transporter substrate-binding protein [Ketogulonicigenium vulgare]AOZ53211.1 peptide ABC transporter ATP-bi